MGGEKCIKFHQDSSHTDELLEEHVSILNFIKLNKCLEENNLIISIFASLLKIFIDTYYFSCKHWNKSLDYLSIFIFF